MDIGRFLSLAVAVIGVPLVLVGDILATEWLLGRPPERRPPPDR